MICSNCIRFRIEPRDVPPKKVLRRDASGFGDNMSEVATRPTGLIPLLEAQSRLPGNPSLRWLSTEARRLGCYRRVGKEAFIIERAWQHFVEGVNGNPCQLP